MNIEETESPFVTRSANEWIATSKLNPTPKFLFGEFWLEGELSILFADTGKGKSILAVQIAESIARGTAIAPLKLTAKPQKVLYLDFELSDKQFEMRYARDAGENESMLKGHYKFSPNFLRAQVKFNFAMDDHDKGAFENALIAHIKSEVERTGVRVLIIDNITYLRRGTVRTEEAISLMRRLRDIRDELGLSILVLAHTPKRHTTWPLNVNDLQGSKILANFADNIFAIGQSRYDTSHRYIKHIKPRSTEMLYDAQHVPSFSLGKRGGNFLSFSFFGWREEAVHLSRKFDSYRLQRADEMKHLAATGLSQRQIAEQCGTSAASVNRFLQMWSPYDEEQERLKIELERQRERDREREQHEAAREKRRIQEQEFWEKKRAKELAEREATSGENNPVDEKPDPRLISPEGKPLQPTEDAYGKLMYVEEFEDNKPKIWYNYDSNGRRKRWERIWTGIHGRTVEGQIRVKKEPIISDRPFGSTQKACGF